MNNNCSETEKKFDWVGKDLFLNHFTTGKAIWSLRPKGVIGMKEKDQTLAKRKDKRRKRSRKIEDCD